MIKKILLLLFIIGHTLAAQSYTRYLIRFNNKNQVNYTTANPSAYLSAKAIQRRTQQGIAIKVEDLPVDSAYIRQVEATGAHVMYSLKWINACVVKLSDSLQLVAINNLPFVSANKAMGQRKKLNDDPSFKYEPMAAEPSTQIEKMNDVNSFSYGSSFNQVNQIGVNCMHNQGYTGKGITIAVLDAGFLNADSLSAFDSLRVQGRLLGSKDFVDGDEFSYDSHFHGTNVLSCLTANVPGTLIGTAPHANFYIIRTEDAPTENEVEEANWMRGAEYADSLGVDIISSSLGYTEGFGVSSSNHNHAIDLDGKTTIGAIAANMASRKGIVVCNAAGNDGSGSWYYIGTPADADSIITVGSVNAAGNKSGFSSFGPTTDGRIKPDVMAQGGSTYLASTDGTYLNSSGTSFATPLTAGAVACLMQAVPGKKVMEYINSIKSTGNNKTTPNNMVGWGIPDYCMAKNYMLGINTPSKTTQVKVYPNPAKNLLSIDLPSGSKLTNCEITDALGKQLNAFIVNTANGVSLDVSVLEAGIYFMNFSVNEESSKIKFVKE